MKRKSIILLLISCIFAGSYFVSAEAHSSITQLDELADEALKLTRFGRYEEAKNLLDRYAMLFSDDATNQRQFSMDERRVLTATHAEAMRTLTSGDLSMEERVKKVTALRLATDALISNYQPLWSDMENPIIQAFQQVKNAAQEGDADAYNQELNAFLSTYSVIQPSLKMDIPVSNLQKLDAKITYVDQYRAQFDEEKMITDLDGLESDLKKLFSDIQEDDVDPSIWWVIGITGSIIISTLSYVGWRKFSGEKVITKRKGPNN